MRHPLRSFRHRCPLPAALLVLLLVRCSVGAESAASGGPPSEGADVERARPAGACCLPDGTCRMMEEEECCDRSGEWLDSESCPESCHFAGACCFPDGRCEFLERDACFAEEGSYAGNDVACEDADCFAQAYVLCCYGRGCCALTTAAGCRRLQGYIARTCRDCGTPSACCLPDGACVVLNRAECEEQGGAYQGPGVTCEDTICDGVPARRENWGRIKSTYR